MVVTGETRASPTPKPFRTELMDFVGEDVCKELAGADGQCLWVLGGGTGPALLPPNESAFAPKSQDKIGYLRLFDSPLESLSYRLAVHFHCHPCILCAFTQHLIHFTLPKLFLACFHLILKVIIKICS